MPQRGWHPDRCLKKVHLNRYENIWMENEDETPYLELGRPVGAQLACEHLLELFARHDVGGRTHALQNARELRRY